MAEFAAEVRRSDVHHKGCACWQCIGRLQAWVLRTQKVSEGDDAVVAALSLPA